MFFLQEKRHHKACLEYRERFFWLAVTLPILLCPKEKQIVSFINILLSLFPRHNCVLCFVFVSDTMYLCQSRIYLLNPIRTLAQLMRVDRVLELSGPIWSIANILQLHQKRYISGNMMKLCCFEISSRRFGQETLHPPLTSQVLASPGILYNCQN